MWRSPLDSRDVPKWNEKAALVGGDQNGFKRKGGQRPGEGGRAFVRQTWQGGGRAIGARLKAIFMIATTCMWLPKCGNSRELPITNS
jgi:hypothetical protein